MYGETYLVERITRALAVPNKGGRTGPLTVGIGDDAAALRVAPGRELVLSCDAFLEGVHFLRGVHPADSVGYKALARAVSDLAAMGAEPTFFFLTLALPGELAGAWLDDFLAGMRRASRELGIVLAGGDTSQFPKVAISLTVLGEVAAKRAAKRSGAHPGDLLYVSGRLGGAQLGLELIRKLSPRTRSAFLDRPRKGTASAVPKMTQNPGVLTAEDKNSAVSLKCLLQPHLYPRIRLALGGWLASKRAASAMMDISDGLSTDLARLCAASGVGARLTLDAIPQVRLSPEEIRLLKARGVKFDPLALALHGGDDYGLLFAVPPKRVALLKRAPGFADLRCIGEATTRRDRIETADAKGQLRELRPGGWDSFRAR